ILAAMKKRQGRQAYLKAELAEVDDRAQIASLDVARFRSNLLERLMDWRGLLQRQTAEARQILRKLLVRRLVFTPREDEEGEVLRVRRQRIDLGGHHWRGVTEGMVAPRGFGQQTCYRRLAA